MNKATGLKRIVNAAGYSWSGLKAAYRNEAAFRQELLLAIILIPLAIWLGETGVERAILIGSTLFVMIIELINSAIEAVVDRFGGEWEVLSGRAKDLGSAAVMLSLILLFVTWSLILF